MTRVAMPPWFTVLMVADMIVVVAAAALLVARGPGPGLAAASLLAGGAAVVGARWLWRRGAETAALAVALLPMIASVPYIFATLGLPF